MKGYIPDAISKIAAMIIAIPISIIILVGLWVYKLTSRRDCNERSRIKKSRSL